MSPFHVRSFLDICILFVLFYSKEQWFRTTLYKLHQWKTATIFQPPHVCTWTRRVSVRRDCMGVYWFWDGSTRLHWTYWKGKGTVNSIHLHLQYFFEFSQVYFTHTLYDEYCSFGDGVFPQNRDTDPCIYDKPIFPAYTKHETNECMRCFVFALV